MPPHKNWLTTLMRGQSDWIHSRQTPLRLGHLESGNQAQDRDGRNTTNMGGGTQTQSGSINLQVDENRDFFQFFKPKQNQNPENEKAFDGYEVFRWGIAAFSLFRLLK